MGADAAVQASLRQVADLLLLVQGRFNNVQLRVVQRQLDVGANHIVLQLQLRLTRLGHAHVGHVHRLLGGIALAAPQIQRITEA